MNDICKCIKHNGDNSKCTNECEFRCEEMFEKRNVE